MTSNDKEFPSNSENEASSLSTSATYSEIDLSLLTSTEGETSPEPHNTPSAIESYTKEASPIFEVKSNELRTSNIRTSNRERMVERDPTDSTYNPSTSAFIFLITPAIPDSNLSSENIPDTMTLNLPSTLPPIRDSSPNQQSHLKIHLAKAWRPRTYPRMNLTAL